MNHVTLGSDGPLAGTDLVCPEGPCRCRRENQSKPAETGDFRAAHFSCFYFEICHFRNRFISGSLRRERCEMASPFTQTTHNCVEHGGDAHRPGGQISPVKRTVVGSFPTLGGAKQQFKASVGKIWCHQKPAAAGGDPRPHPGKQHYLRSGPAPAVK